MLSGRRETREKPSVTKDAAREALLKLFGEGESVELSAVEELAEELGCSKRTMYNVKNELGIQNVSAYFGEVRKTFWLTPEADKEEFLKNVQRNEHFAHS